MAVSGSDSKPSTGSGLPLSAANIGPGWPAAWFERGLAEGAGEFAWSCLAPAILPFCPDDAIARAHWPWAAFALSSYRNSQRRGRDERDVKPSKAAALLSEIAKHSDALDAALRELKAAHEAALANGNKPKFLALAKAHRAIIGVFDDPQLRRVGRLDPEAHPDFVEWQIQLYEIARSAEEAGRVLARTPDAAAGSGQRVPGVASLVTLCGSIWKSMTGRDPTAERVEKKGQSDATPDFVRFIQALCAAADLKPVPTLSMVKTALSHQ